VAGLTATLDALTASVAPVEPGQGFVERVLAGGPVPPGTGTGGSVSPRTGRDRRRTQIGRPRVVLAVVAVVAFVTGVAAVVVPHVAGGHDRRSPTGAFPTVAVADLVTASDGAVGQATVFGHRDAWVTVSLDVPLIAGHTGGDGRYTVVLVEHGGRQIPLGTVSLRAGKGGLDAATGLSAAEIECIRVETTSGRSLCTGYPLPPRQGSGSGE
jgi:hypothetical protein